MLFEHALCSGSTVQAWLTAKEPMEKETGCFTGHSSCPLLPTWPLLNFEHNKYMSVRLAKQPC